MTSVLEQDQEEKVVLTPETQVAEPTEPAGDAQEQAPANWDTIKGVVREVLETVVFTLVIFLLIQTVVRNFRVVGNSMEPNLHNGQYLVIDKVSYRIGDPQRGDVVVFAPPMRPDEDYVKRIVGLPGETVEVQQGRVLVNGMPLDEPYVVRPASYSMSVRQVGEDEYFVLGDNRNSSSDSHSWGMLPEANLVGRAWVSYWPPARWGSISRDVPTQQTTLSSWVRAAFGH